MVYRLHRLRIVVCLCICFCITFSGYIAAGYLYDYTVCAMFQNEAKYLMEWIEFHVLTGAQKFYLYNNRSTDKYSEVLQPYLNSGIVQLFDWPYTNENLKAQIAAFNNTLRIAQDEARWVAFLDLDEFLFPVKEYLTRSFLKDYEDYAQVSVNWVLFGTSDIQEISFPNLMIETLRRSCSKGNKHVKNIVQPSKVTHFINPHWAEVKPGFLQVNSDKKAFWGPFSPYIALDKIRINHYWTRDERWLRTIKIPRGESLRVNNMVTDDDSWFIPKNKSVCMTPTDWIMTIAGYMNDDYDYSIEKYAERLRRKILYKSKKFGH